jgi:hypothetical protein
MLRKGARTSIFLYVFFALVLFKFKAIPESILSYPNECPGEPGKKDVM